MKLMSKPPLKQSTLIQETTAAGQDTHSILRLQSQQISAQQTQIKSLFSALSSRDVSSRRGGKRRCWVCGPAEHLRRNCPERAEGTRPATLPVHSGNLGGEFKLIGPTEASHVVGEHSTYGDSIIGNAVGHCPEVKVKLGGVDVGYLIDTGSEVSTTTEGFYKEFLAQGRKVIKVTS